MKILLLQEKRQKEPQGFGFLRAYNIICDMKSLSRKGTEVVVGLIKINKLLSLVFNVPDLTTGILKMTTLFFSFATDKQKEKKRKRQTLLWYFVKVLDFSAILAIPQKRMHLTYSVPEEKLKQNHSKDNSHHHQNLWPGCCCCCIVVGA